MPKQKTVTHPWDITRYLESDEAIIVYLDAALDEDDPALLAAALGDVARAKGMTFIARETGLGRESLYKTLSPEGNPEFGTVQKIVRSLGLKLQVSSAEEQPPVSTQHAGGAAVPIDAGEYESMRERLETLEDIVAARAQLEAGDGVEHAAAKARLLREIGA